jgi:hypothetical protein
VRLSTHRSLDPAGEFLDEQSSSFPGISKRASGNPRVGRLVSLASGNDQLASFLSRTTP